MGIVDSELKEEVVVMGTLACVMPYDLQLIDQ